MLHIYNKKNNSILITLEHNCIDKKFKLDWIHSDADDLYLNICGRKPQMKLHLYEIDSKVNSYESMKNLLNNLKIEG